MKIQLQHCTKKFKDFTLFNDISLTLEGNQLIGLVGPSGSGKTTLLNILGLIEPMNKGKIKYDGKIITTTRQKQKLLRNEIGFIFQDYGLMTNETVYTNLKLVDKVSKSRNKKQLMDNALTKVGLQGFGNRHVYELSGGEQQRVAIAKMILKQCTVIYADEPSASLDEENKSKMMQLFNQLINSNDTLIIVATHDPYLIEQCQHVIYMNDLKGEL